MFSEDVAGLFDAYLEKAEREEFGRDLANMVPEEAVECYGLAEQLLEGYVVAAEAFEQPVYIVFADARERACLARLIASAQAGYARG